MQKILIVSGLLLLVIALLWPWLGSLPRGRLPGDIVVERENFRLDLPVTTMLIASVLLSLIFRLFR